VYLAGLVGAAASLIMTASVGFDTWDGLATDMEVRAAVRTSMAKHAATVQIKIDAYTAEQKITIASLQDALDGNTELMRQLLAGQAEIKIGGKLDSLYKLKCQTGTTDLDDTIDDLKREYLAKVGEAYVFKGCEQYLTG